MKTIKQRNSTGLTEFQLNKENPFLKQAIEQVQKSIVKKYKTASSTDQKLFYKLMIQILERF